MAVSVILVMLVLMPASLHLPVNESIRDPSDVSPDDGIP